MPHGSQDQPSKKKGKKVTIENFYRGKTQATEEKEDEIQTKSKPSPQNGNCPQALEELKMELIQKMETFWQEKWEKIQREVNSLIDKKSQMEKQLEASNSRAHKTEKQNQSLKTRIKQLEDNDLTKQQELIKQSKKINELEENIKYLTDKVTDKENRRRRDNLRIIGLPEKPEVNKNLNAILQEIIQENCPDVLKQGGKIEIEMVHRTPSILNPQKTTPSNVIAKFKNFQAKEKILQEAKKRNFRYKGAPIRITQDLAAAMLKDRKAWNTIFRKARELVLQPRISYPSKLTIYFQGKVWVFNKIENFQIFVKKRPELIGKCDIQTQRAREKVKYEKVNMKEREKEKNVFFSFTQTLFYKGYN
uniref:L1 transposable element RRM domain-containing protein n=1 Tax=Monodelphis domestica TaxID=13616 RepID=F7EK59_MONDO